MTSYMKHPYFLGAKSLITQLAPLSICNGDVYDSNPSFHVNKLKKTASLASFTSYLHSILPSIEKLKRITLKEIENYNFPNTLSGLLVSLHLKM